MDSDCKVTSCPREQLYSSLSGRDESRFAVAKIGIGCASNSSVGELTASISSLGVSHWKLYSDNTRRERERESLGAREMIT